MVKVTFTLDEATLDKLNWSAARLGESRSDIVRLAIRAYAKKIGRPREQRRTRLLRAFDELVPRIPVRPVAKVEQEIRAVRAARHWGGRAVRAHR